MTFDELIKTHEEHTAVLKRVIENNYRRISDMELELAFRTQDLLEMERKFAIANSFLQELYENPNTTKDAVMKTLKEIDG